MTATPKKTKRKKISEREELIALNDEANTFKALDMLAKSEGGQILIQSHVKDIVSIVESIATNYGEMQIINFIAKAAEIKSKLDVVNTLTRAETNKNFTLDLLEEELQKIPD